MLSGSTHSIHNDLCMFLFLTEFCLPLHNNRPLKNNEDIHRKIKIKKMSAEDCSIRIGEAPRRCEKFRASLAIVYVT